MADLTTREDLILKAKQAEHMERAQDCAALMTRVVNECCNAENGLSKEERNLLSSAYKDIIGKKRASIRILIEDQADPEPELNYEGNGKEIAAEFKKEIQREITDVCEVAVGVVKKLIEPIKVEEASTLEDWEKIAFYNKMCGDYYRYQAEYMVENGLEKVKAGADEHYKAAKAAADNLPATHPTRLGLSLNMSVFMYEIQGLQSAAFALADEAHKLGMEGLSKIEDEGEQEDSSVVLDLLKDNLELWKEDMAENAGPAVDTPANGAVACGSPVNAARTLNGDEDAAEGAGES